MAAVLAAILIVLSLSLSALAQDAGVQPSPTPDVELAETLAAPVVPDELGEAVVSPSPSPLTVTVEAGDVWFSPTEITIDAEQETVLSLTDVGLAAHNLIIDELGLQLHVGPGITSEIDVSDLPPGTYQFYCSIYGHARAGMVGTLTVEGPAATSSPEPVT
ncbi:MAG: cupredoxin domain-containing protein [Candidatus Limnocylindrales bacterium]